jgi:hypothetical protein
MIIYDSPRPDVMNLTKLKKYVLDMFLGLTGFIGVKLI